MTIKFLSAFLLAVFSWSALACTTWFSMPDANSLGKIIMHKNRDNGDGAELPFIMKITPSAPGKLRTIDICEYMFYNEKGLGITNNALLIRTTDYGPDKIRISKFMRQAAESCSTVQEVLALIRKTQEKHCLECSNLLVTDGNLTAMIELTSRHHAVRFCNSGTRLHTNHYLYKELQEYYGEQKDKENSRTRLWLTRSKMRQYRLEHGPITLSEFLILSRYHDARYPDLTPFRNSTVCAADYIVDKDYPAWLSTILIQPGPPCCTLAIPVPLCCQSMPEALKNGELGRLSFQIKRIYGTDFEEREKLKSLEWRFWENYCEAALKAKEMMKLNQKDEAAAMLQNLLEKQVLQALDLLKSLVAKYPVTDYSKKENWAQLGGKNDQKVDLFYVYGTCSVFGTLPKKAAAISKNTRETVGMMMRSNNEIFGSFTNVYVPYYRQISLAGASKAQNAKEYLDMVDNSVALDDIYAALDYYFEHCNQGRPFILAGHSQGAAILQKVLRTYLKKHPEYQKRMIAAYAAGFSFSRSWLKKRNHLKFAEGETDTGVIISWNTEGPGSNGKSMLIQPDSVAINPLNWKRDATPAPAEANKGSLQNNVHELLSGRKPYTPQDVTVKIVPGLADATLDVNRGVVICTTVKNYVSAPAFGDKSLHTGDWNLYAVSIRENMQKRIAAFFAQQR